MQINGYLAKSLRVTLLTVSAVLSATLVFAGTGTIDQASGKACVYCHGSKVANKKLHAPLADNECGPCHANSGGNHQRQKGLYSPKKPIAKLCVECHDNFNVGTSIHGPIKNDECLGCHYAHFSANKKLLRQPAGAQFCFSCHNQGKYRGTFPHQPVADGACLDCHTHHNSKSAKLLKQADICISCHDKSLVTGKSVHAPVREGDCGGCHDVHGGPRVRLLKGGHTGKAVSPFKKEDYELCFSCHDVKAFTEKKIDSATGFRDGTSNLHYVHVVGSGYACQNCHDFHAAGQDRLIREKFGKDKDQVTITFKLKEMGASCTTSCHDAMEYAPGK